MAIKPELEAWIKTLPEATQKLLMPEFEKEEVQKTIGAHFVPRSEVSKALDTKDQEVAAQRQQLEADQRAAQAAKQSYDTFKASEEKRVQKFYADTNAALANEQAQRKAYEKRLGDLVSQGLITQEEATVAKQEFTPVPAAQPPVETKKYVSKDDLESTIVGSYAQNARNIARLNDIASLHQELFGERLNQRELVETALKSEGNKTVEQIWAEKYGVEQKRAELQKAQFEAEKKAAIEEALVRDRSERAIAGDNAPYSGLDDPVTGHKHILSIFSEKDGKSRGLGVSPAVAKATEAWRQKQATAGVGNGNKTG